MLIYTKLLRKTISVFQRLKQEGVTLSAYFISSSRLVFSRQF